MSVQLAAQNIRLNCVHPTNCNTDMLHNNSMYRVFRPDLETPTLDDVTEGMKSIMALDSAWVEPLDVSLTVLFLASDESRFITGSQLRVDAGGSAKLLPYRHVS